MKKRHKKHFNNSKIQRRKNKRELHCHSTPPPSRTHQHHGFLAGIGEGQGTAGVDGTIGLQRIPLLLQRSETRHIIVSARRERSGCHCKVSTIYGRGLTLMGTINLVL